MSHNGYPTLMKGGESIMADRNSAFRTGEPWSNPVTMCVKLVREQLTEKEKHAKLSR